MNYHPIFYISLLFGIIAVSGCKREHGCTDPAASNYNPNARVDNGTCAYNGQATFYFPNYGPTASVTINGQTAQITQVFTGGITSCNVEGCANFSMPKGSYPYTASSSALSWSGTIGVDAGGCSIVQLANADVTFWSSSFNNVTVTIGGQTATITQNYATSPGCSVAGCANFYLPVSSGAYIYSATDGVNQWNGNITVNAITDCYSIQLN